MCKERVIMPFLLLSLSTSLIFSVELNTDYITGMYNITPLHYELILTPKIEEGFFSGECRITIRIEEKKQTISFHSYANGIEAATLKKINPYNEPCDPKHVIATYTPKKYGFFFQMGLVKLDFNKTIGCGYYVLEIQFYSKFTENITIDGFFRTSCTDLSGNKAWMIVTRTQMSGPQTIFPCWNNPRFKTVFDVSIRHPKNYMAFSNSRIHNSTFDKDMMWTHFESTPPISPHCITIVAMPEHIPYRDQYNHDHIMLWSLLDNFAHQTQLDFTWNIIMKVKTYLEQLNIVDQCKVTDANYIAATGFSETDIIATHAFVIYREQYILFTESISSVKDKLNVICFIVQQIVHQWILRSINSLSWSSSWLYGATNFFSTYILRKILPQLEWVNSSILMDYEETYSTSFYFDVEDIVEFIISSRSPNTSLCDVGNVRKEKKITTLSYFLKSEIEN